jgi:hypothetical protein
MALRYREAAAVYGLVPGTPISGCDPPQPASNAATLMQSAWRLAE